MTPKLKLREQDRKLLLSCIRKFFLPGNNCTMRSTQMTVAPKQQAVAYQYRMLVPSPIAVFIPIPLMIVMIQPLTSLSRTAILATLRLGEARSSKGTDYPDMCTATRLVRIEKSLFNRGARGEIG
jgi:hypothetical protein